MKIAATMSLMLEFVVLQTEQILTNHSAVHPSID